VSRLASHGARDRQLVDEVGKVGPAEREAAPRSPLQFDDDVAGTSGAHISRWKRDD